MEKPIFPFKILYQGLNMMPIENFKSLILNSKHIHLFQKLDQKQQKTCQILRFLQFFSKKLKFLQF